MAYAPGVVFEGTPKTRRKPCIDWKPFRIFRGMLVGESDFRTRNWTYTSVETVLEVGYCEANAEDEALEEKLMNIF